MTVDQEPLPGEPVSGRHRPARLYPLGVELHHVIARAGYAHTALAHVHHGGQQ
jgi:hypothetical protein